MEKSIVDAVTAAVNNAVPSAINNAVPAWVNTTFTTLIDQAVEEKCKDKLEQMKQAMEKMEKSMEKKIARSEKAARLEAKVSAVCPFLPTTQRLRRGTDTYLGFRYDTRASLHFERYGRFSMGRLDR
jgi:hypothetical protein